MNQKSPIFDMPTVLTIIGGVAVTVSMFYGVRLDQAKDHEKIVYIEKTVTDISEKIGALEKRLSPMVKARPHNEDLEKLLN